MKKIFAILLAAIMTFAFTGCSKKDDSDIDVNNTGAPETESSQPNAENTEKPEEPTKAPAHEAELTLESLMAREPSPEEYFSVTKDISGGAYILDYTGDESVVVFPEKIESLTSASIDGYVFSNSKTLEGIRFADSMIYIGDFVCSECEALKYVVIGENVETIGMATFHGCINLEKVVFGSKLKSIGKSAFGVCPKLKEIEIPESVTSIDELAFSGAPDDFKVIGKSGSYAETYAKEHGFEFIAK